MESFIVFFSETVAFNAFCHNSLFGSLKSYHLHNNLFMFIINNNKHLFILVMESFILFLTASPAHAILGIASVLI